MRALKVIAVLIGAAFVLLFALAAPALVIPAAGILAIYAWAYRSRPNFVKSWYSGTLSWLGGGGTSA